MQSLNSERFQLAADFGHDRSQFEKSAATPCLALATRYGFTSLSSPRRELSSIAKSATSLSRTRTPLSSDNRNGFRCSAMFSNGHTHAQKDVDPDVLMVGNPHETWTCD